MQNLVQEGQSRGRSDGRDVVLRISAYAVRRLRADRTGWRCRSAEQDACGLVGLSGLYGASGPATREAVDAAWGSHLDAQAKQNLRKALSRLRKVLGQTALESDGETVSLNAAGETETQ